MESGLNEGEKIGDAERALESENAEDDHDRRKLKKDDRMRLVVRNKDEGTELFKGGVYKQAAIRYTKGKATSKDDSFHISTLKGETVSEKYVLRIRSSKCKANFAEGFLYI